MAGVCEEWRGWRVWSLCNRSAFLCWDITHQKPETRDAYQVLACHGEPNVTKVTENNGLMQPVPEILLQHRETCVQNTNYNQIILAWFFFSKNGPFEHVIYSWIGLCSQAKELTRLLKYANLDKTPANKLKLVFWWSLVGWRQQYRFCGNIWDINKMKLVFSPLCLHMIIFNISIKRREVMPARLYNASIITPVWNPVWYYPRLSWNFVLGTSEVNTENAQPCVVPPCQGRAEWGNRLKCIVWMPQCPPRRGDVTHSKCMMEQRK